MIISQLLWTLKERDGIMCLKEELAVPLIEEFCVSPKCPTRHKKFLHQRDSNFFLQTDDTIPFFESPQQPRNDHLPLGPL